MNVRIINAKFLEIEAKKTTNSSNKLDIKTNIQINSLEQSNKSKDIIKTTYFFEIDYGGLGWVKLSGEIFFLSDQKTIKTILKNKENKEYNSPEYTTITNYIMQKASIKAFELEEEIGLPIHVRLPIISIKNK